MMRFMLVIVAMGLLCSRGFSHDYVIIKPEPMTTAKLLERAEAYTRDYPKDPGGFATLGKIHATAFRFQAVYLNSRWSSQFSRDKPPFILTSKSEFAPIEAEAMVRIQMRRVLRQMPPKEDPAFRSEIDEQIARLRTEGWEEPVLTPALLIQHYKAAEAAFEKAANMPSDGNPDHRAGDLIQLAHLQELILDPKRRAAWQGINSAPEAIPLHLIAEDFERAFDLIYNYDQHMIPEIVADVPISRSVSYQAAEGYLRCLPRGPRAAEMTAYLQKLRDLETKAKARR
jgi:hypothetical protein